MAYLQIKNFCKSFDGLKVLKGIDLDIEKGEVVSIIGSSGSGKTTLLRCINFLETTDDGEMYIEDDCLIDRTTIFDSDDVLRNKRLNFGMVFQSFNLFPQYNVFDNITLAPTLLLKSKVHPKKQKDLYHAEKERIDKEAYALLETIGLTDKKNAYPCELSGGQCQRVAIARALALKPKILCFDEPTSALDPELTGEVLKVIKSLKGQDRTMIIVTHEMGFAKKVSDKIVFMANGKIEEMGTPSEIFDNPKSDLLKAFLSNIDKKDGE
ncbi:MAG: amino acid ABC transporter ATP-binding protein [Clostridiales bacterium]|nr:amino acid ABC transporter ATP-binding protein [Clostridiales bacterium]